LKWSSERFPTRAFNKPRKTVRWNPCKFTSLLNTLYVAYLPYSYVRLLCCCYSSLSELNTNIFTATHTKYQTLQRTELGCQLHARRSVQVRPRVTRPKGYTLQASSHISLGSVHITWGKRPAVQAPHPWHHCYVLYCSWDLCPVLPRCYATVLFIMLSLCSAAVVSNRKSVKDDIITYLTNFKEMSPS
jgi:hypothetical protein